VPTIEVLQSIAQNFNDTLGADQGNKHAPPDLTNDIEALMKNLDNNDVYRYQKERVLHEDTGGTVKDIIKVTQYYRRGEDSTLCVQRNIQALAKTALNEICCCTS
jgi:replication-associated recombination protein RarA